MVSIVCATVQVSETDTKKVEIIYQQFAIIYSTITRYELRTWIKLDDKFKYFNSLNIFKAADGNSFRKLPAKSSECTFSAPVNRNKGLIMVKSLLPLMAKNIYLNNFTSEIILKASLRNYHLQIRRCSSDPVYWKPNWRASISINYGMRYQQHLKCNFPLDQFVLNFVEL